MFAIGWPVTETKLRGHSISFYADYDFNSLYAGCVTPISFTPAPFTPSIYSREDHVLVIEGPWACDVDMDRGLKWSAEQGIDVFPTWTVSDQGDGHVYLHFQSVEDAVVAMLALA
jgi:hypothetical protein